MIPVVVLQPEFINNGILFESISFESPKSNSKYDIKNASEFEFKKSKCNVHEKFMMDATTKKYIEYMSPTVLYALTNAHFISRYQRDKVVFDDEKDAECEVTAYWFGLFFRQFDVEFLERSILAMHHGFNISLCINYEDMFFIQHSQTLPNEHQIMKIDKRRVDFSNYGTFIRSMNTIAKMVKIAQIPKDSWNPTNQARYILLKEHFSNLEDFYEEIITNKFHI